MANRDQLLETIKNVIAEQLHPAQVVSVDVEEDFDHEGDEILRVEVVFSVEGHALDPRKVVGLARHLREPLQKLHVDRFPVFTFMTMGEFDGAAAWLRRDGAAPSWYQERKAA